MYINRAVSGILLTASFLLCGVAYAEDDLPSADTPAADASAAPDPNQASTAATPATPAPAGDDDKVHISSTGYLWFAGVHGNYGSSLLGYNLGYKASPGDLLSHADLGYMHLLGLQYHRLIVIQDFYVAPFTVNTKTIYPQVPAQLPTGVLTPPSLSAKFTYTQVELSLETGYRVYNGPKFKFDGLAGFRFWHNGYGLTVYENGVANPHRSISTNYTDPLIGGRMAYPLSEKLVAQVWGDVGGWGSGSQLEYQLVGALTYNIRPKYGLDIAWRYNWLSYRNGPFLTNTWAYSGIVIGFTSRYAVGGK
jgi:hypothetical protein